MGLSIDALRLVAAAGAVATPSSRTGAPSGQACADGPTFSFTVLAASGRFTVYGESVAGVACGASILGRSAAAAAAAAIVASRSAAVSLWEPSGSRG